MLFCSVEHSAAVLQLLLPLPRAAWSRDDPEGQRWCAIIYMRRRGWGNPSITLQELSHTTSEWLVPTIVGAAFKGSTPLRPETRFEDKITCSLYRKGFGALKGLRSLHAADRCNDEHLFACPELRSIPSCMIRPHRHVRHVRFSFTFVRITIV